MKYQASSSPARESVGIAKVRARPDPTSKTPTPSVDHLWDLYLRCNGPDTPSSQQEFVDQMLVDWPNERFAAVLDDALRRPYLMSERYLQGGLPFCIFTSWLRTDPVSAVSWLDRLHSKEWRLKFLNQAWQSWPESSALAGFETLLERSSEFEDGSVFTSDRLLSAALDQAMSGRGMTGMRALLEAITTSGIRFPGDELQFPSNFDFLILTKLEGNEGILSRLRSAGMSAWCRSNPAEYMAHLVEQADWEGFKTTLSRSDDPLSRKSVMEAFSEADRESRLRMLEGGIDNHFPFIPSTTENSPNTGTTEAERWIALAELIPGTDARIDWVSAGLRSISPDQAKLHMDLLETLPDPQERLSLLQELHPSVHWNPMASGHSGIDETYHRVVLDAIQRWHLPFPKMPPPQLEPDPFADR